MVLPHIYIRITLNNYNRNLSDVARGYVDSLFCLGSCGDSISVKLRFCRAAVSRRRSSDVDDAAVQRHLIEECRRSNSEISS